MLLEADDGDRVALQSLKFASLNSAGEAYQNAYVASRSSCIAFSTDCMHTEAISHS